VDAGREGTSRRIDRRAQPTCGCSRRRRPGPDRHERAEFVRRTTALTVPAVLAASGLRIPLGEAKPQGSFVLDAAQLAQVRRNASTWSSRSRDVRGRTPSEANGWLGHRPSLTRSDADVSDWREAIYLPALRDGNAAVTLAMACGREAKGVRTARQGDLPRVGPKVPAGAAPSHDRAHGRRARRARDQAL
jgi:hypothetical protein